MSSFFQEGYQVPTSGESRYMKFEQGTNKFRILTPPVMGYQYFTNDNKPNRSKERFESIPTDAKLEDGKFKQSHFWAIKVYNYTNERIEILMVTQKGIQNAIVGYAQSEEYGDPREFDITVTRKGEKYETEYTVMPSPPKPLKPEVVEANNDTQVNLNALFSGDNPFDGDAFDEAEVEL